MPSGGRGRALSAYFKLDSAGRVLLPRSFREALRGAVLYVLRDPEALLRRPAFRRLLFTTPEARARMLMRLRAMPEEAAGWLRAWILHTAEMRVPDEMGRITLGEELRSWADIREQYRITGFPEQGYGFVWARETYEAWLQWMEAQKPALEFALEVLLGDEGPAAA